MGDWGWDVVMAGKYVGVGGCLRATACWLAEGALEISKFQAQDDRCCSSPVAKARHAIAPS